MLAECQARGWRLGGESSGHLLILDAHTTGDGIVAALQVLAALRDLDESLAVARSGLELYPQVLINVAAADPGRCATDETIAAAVAAAERELGERGRVLLRPSGTEPLVRVMVEGRDEALIRAQAESLAATVGDVMG